MNAFTRSLALAISLHSFGCASPSVPAIQPETRTVLLADEKVMNPGFTWVPADQLDPDFRATNEPFADVLKRLGEDVLVNFQLDEPVLAAAGVRMDVPVTVHVAKAKTASALDAICKNVTEQTPGKPALAYTLWGRNQILITTRAELLANHTYTREYALVEFLAPQEDERARAFMALIKETVDPSSWDATGSKCTITASKDVLRVTQTHENLKHVEQIMEDINATYVNDMLERRLHFYGKWVKNK